MNGMRVSRWSNGQKTSVSFDKSLKLELDRVQVHWIGYFISFVFQLEQIKTLMARNERKKTGNKKVTTCCPRRRFVWASSFSLSRRFSITSRTCFLAVWMMVNPENLWNDKHANYYLNTQKSKFVYTNVAIHSFLPAEMGMSWWSTSFPFGLPSPPSRWTCGTGLGWLVHKVQRIKASGSLHPSNYTIYINLIRLTANLHHC